jgi:hypothetical protein
VGVDGARSIDRRRSDDRREEEDMKAFVVYESLYGNTAGVGEAIAASLRAQAFEVEAALVSKIDPAEVADVDLLVVGGPTHVHGLSSSRSRRTAAGDEKNAFAEPTLDPGLRTWLKELAPATARLAAAFDTRIDKPVIVTGSAAKAIGRRLEGAGYRLVAEPRSFLVSTKNELIDGELAQAASWGEDVGRTAAAQVDPLSQETRRPTAR